MLFQDGLDFLGLDKLIESIAPPSPGSAKDDEQVFLFGGGLGFRLGQNLVGAGSGLGRG